MFPCAAWTEDQAWQRGPVPGVERMGRQRNATPGGGVALRKFKAGVTIPAHTLPDATEWGYALAGEGEASDVPHTVDTLFSAPESARRGPHVARPEGINRPPFDGPLTVGGWEITGAHRAYGWAFNS